MVNQTRRRVASRQGAAEGFDREITLQAVTRGPAGDAPEEEVQNDGEVDLSHGTFTTAEHQSRALAQGCLTFWCTKLEAEFARSVFSENETDMAIDFDLSGMLRGDPETRWASRKIAIEAGVLTPAEVREIEGFNPRKAAEGEGMA